MIIKPLEKRFTAFVENLIEVRVGRPKKWKKHKSDGNLGDTETVSAYPTNGKVQPVMVKLNLRTVN